MVEYPGVHLRVNPQAIPQLRGAFENAYAMLEPEIRALGQEGWLDGAWLGDPKSDQVAADYNAKVMAAEDGPYQALVLYQNELLRIIDQLTVIEQDYQRNEQATRDSFDGSAL